MKFANNGNIFTFYVGYPYRSPYVKIVRKKEQRNAKANHPIGQNFLLRSSVLRGAEIYHLAHVGRANIFDTNSFELTIEIFHARLLYRHSAYTMFDTQSARVCVVIRTYRARVINYFYWGDLNSRLPTMFSTMFSGDNFFFCPHYFTISVLSLRSNNGKAAPLFPPREGPPGGIKTA